MLPSLVTCPTIKTGTPLSLAKRNKRPVASRTWLMLPAAPGTPGQNIVWIESMITRAGRRSAAACKIDSRLVSASTHNFSSVAPVRRARIPVWAADSSPET